MNIPCKVIEDLLPMYYDKVCSEESASVIGEHLKECPGCSRILRDLQGELELPEVKGDDMAPLRKLRKSFRKLRLGWFLAAVCVLVLVPVAFLTGIGNGREGGRPVEFSKEEAADMGNAFMRCLVERNYDEAFGYWNIEGEKQDLVSGNLFTEAELVNFEADGLEKFCQGGRKLEDWGGIEAFALTEISGPSYHNRYATEEYHISYTVRFDGKDESFGISLSKDGIDHISSGGGLIKHPLSHLTLWVQWVVDDYQGQYYDFELGQWVEQDRRPRGE